MALLWQYTILVLFVLVVLTPIVMLVFAGLKSRGELAVEPYTPPNPIRLENYVRILNMPTTWQMLANSLIIMVAATGGLLVVASLAAFPLARMEFRAKSWAFNLFTTGLLFPSTVAALPVYILLRQLGLLNNYLGVILPEIAFALSGYILILRGFFEAIPAELQDAAYIDGCSTFAFFWRVLIPLARPGLAAVGVLMMIASWNELLWPLLVFDHDNMWTLPLGTMQFQGQYGQDLALVLAFVTLSMIPTVVFYLFAERQIVFGLTAGAVKG
ncbi:MAG: carbohydrate ABC transporter permease [Chloroflexi bacterium]|nr:carbohydrate ABC transporter permease [Chloroflexota bacterium]